MSILTGTRLQALGPLAAAVADSLIGLGNDIALILDEMGVVLYVAPGGSVAVATSAQRWEGLTWWDAVESENSQKLAQLIREVLGTGTGRRREINHQLADASSVSVAYTAIRLGEQGPVLAVGRDLSAIVSIQKRFVQAHQQLERTAGDARQAEARYRQLFQVATDAVVVADAQTLQILEANQAACELFELAASQLSGRSATFGFEKVSGISVGAMLTHARAQGQGCEIMARLSGRITPVRVSITPFGLDETMRLMLRIRVVEMPGTAVNLEATLARMVDCSSDGVVVTDATGMVLIANPAFLKLASMNSEQSVRGRPMMDWIGLSQVQFAILLSQVRNQGISTRVVTRLLGADAKVSRVEVSAGLVCEAHQDCIGFTIHRL